MHRRPPEVVEAAIRITARMEASAFRKKRSVLNSQASCCRKDGSLGFQEKALCS